eukprot:CAMPEP_0171476802 /NCGR_PEP_ID=MMETSP0946-20130122/3806_1 /TAXON_ID=109269 /ORGANISM="Vaucheria litorea, Strain CCMP2940" /LENGTH=143 /DNA_ID=CAMNT_0012007131 /DNA_START=3584 /DNA_END=4016 /DNA_ORIENTATION=-
MTLEDDPPVDGLDWCAPPGVRLLDNRAIGAGSVRQRTFPAASFKMGARRTTSDGEFGWGGNLLNDNTGVPRSAQRERKSRAEQKGKSWTLTRAPSTSAVRESEAYRSFSGRPAHPPPCLRVRRDGVPPHDQENGPPQGGLNWC